LMVVSIFFAMIYLSPARRAARSSRSPSATLRQIFFT
jgi:hypothetical protein